MEPLMLSGIQHFAYCRRQWALVHVEEQWLENEHTIEGELMHERAHDEKQTELRDSVLTVRGMRIESKELGITGCCDVVEFHRGSEGIALSERDGLWTVYPVEYKKGKPKPHQADELQLCAEAMCLEEMLACSIPEGSLYYGEPRRRLNVEFTKELRETVESLFREMRQYMERGYTPIVRKHKGCMSCSLRDICLPELESVGSVAAYLKGHAEDDS